jgi:hypothetical protein
VLSVSKIPLLQDMQQDAKKKLQIFNLAPDENM